MPRDRLTFRQRDLTAAIKAAKAAGEQIARIEITHAGIKIILGKPENLTPRETRPQTPERASNPWNEVFNEGDVAPEVERMSRPLTPKDQRYLELLNRTDPKEVMENTERAREERRQRREARLNNRGMSSWERHR